MHRLVCHDLPHVESSHLFVQVPVSPQPLGFVYLICISGKLVCHYKNYPGSVCCRFLLAFLFRNNLLSAFLPIFHHVSPTHNNIFSLILPISIDFLTFTRTRRRRCPWNLSFITTSRQWPCPTLRCYTPLSKALWKRTSRSSLCSAWLRECGRVDRSSLVGRGTTRSCCAWGGWGRGFETLFGGFKTRFESFEFGGLGGYFLFPDSTINITWYRGLL